MTLSTNSPDRTQSKMRDDDKAKEQLTGGLSRKNWRVNKQKKENISYTDEEKRLKAIADNSNMGIYVVQDGRFIFANSMFQEYIGYSEEELVGMDFLSVVYPEDKDMASENAVNILKGQISTPYELRYVNKGGKITRVIELIAAIDYRGRQAILGNLIDNNHRKYMKAGYRRLLDDMSDGYIVIQDKEIVFANRRFGEISGYDPEHIVGKPIADFLVPDVRPEKMEQYDRVMHGPEAVPELHEAIMMKGNGALIVVETTTKIIQYEGKTAAYVFVRDITGQKQAKDQLEHRLKIEEAITNVSRLFASRMDVDLNEVLRILGEAAAVDRVSIFQFYDDGKKADNTYEWCSPGTESQIQNLQGLDSILFSWWMDKLRAGENMLILDVDDLPAEAVNGKSMLNDLNIHSCITVPIYMSSGIFKGIIGFSDAEKYRSWSDEDASLLRVVAEMLASYWERKQAEEKYRQLLEDMNDGYGVIQDGVYVFANRRFCEMLGREPEQILGSSIAEFMIPERRQAEMGLYERVICGEEALAERYDGEIVSREGEKTILEASSKPVQYNDKPAIGVILRDVTDHRRAEEQIKHRLKIERAVTSISKLFTSQFDVDLNEVIRILGETVLANRAYIFQYRQEGEKMDNTHEWCSPGAKPRMQNLRGLDCTLFPWWMGELRAGRNIVLPDFNAIDSKAISEEELLQAQDIRSLVVVPVNMAGYNLAGFMGFEDADKSRLWTDEDVSLLRIGAEIIAGYLDRKRVEEKYKHLLEDMGDGYAVVQDRHVVFANRRFGDIFGCKPEQVAGSSLMDYLPSHERRAAKEYHEMLMRHGGRISIERYEAMAIKKDGMEIPVECTIKAIEYNGKPAFSVLVRDVSQRKRAEVSLRDSEEKLRLVFESVPEGIAICDLEGEIMDVNDGGVRMHGYDTKEEIIGQSCFNLLSDRDNIKARECIKMALETGKSGVARYMLVKKDGSEFAAMTSAAVLRDAAGQPSRLVIISMDTTEQQEMQEQLMLADRLASIGQLAAGIAHEINNPLTSVIGFSELLLEEDFPDRIKEDLETIDEEANRAAEVVKGLLTFVRGKGTEKTPIDVNSIIQTVLHLRSYEQKVNNIEVDTEFALDMPRVTGNGSQIQQVIMNLVVNAEQAMIGVHGKGRIKVTTEEDGDIIRISIDDDGPGISSENLKRLFIPFFTTKEVGKGTGLGLSICHGIVAEHGGRIYAESELGKGARFIIELPIMSDRGESDEIY